VIALRPVNYISQVVSVFKFPEAAAEARANPQMRQVVSSFSQGFDTTKLDLSGSQKARPFVSPMAWAVFSAYLAILMQAVVKFSALKFGVGKDYTNYVKLSELVKSVLPHQSDFIEEYGSDAYHYLLGELEERLLVELRSMLAGVEDDKKTVAQAAQIQKLAEEVQNAMRADQSPEANARPRP